MTPEYNFKIQQGTDFSIKFIIKFQYAKKCSGIFKRVDLTGYTASLQMRKEAGGELVKELTPDNDGLLFEELNAQVTAKFTHEMTAAFEPRDYVYEIRLKQTEGNKIYKLVSGTITVVQRINEIE